MVSSRVIIKIFKNFRNLARKVYEAYTSTSLECWPLTNHILYINLPTDSLKHAQNISKICRQILILPEVMGVLVRPKLKKFSIRSQKIYF